MLTSSLLCPGQPVKLPLPNSSERAKQAIVLTGKLFEIERKLKSATPKQRKAARKQRAGPVVGAF